MTTMSNRLEKFLACPHKRVQDYSECCLDCGENIYTKPQEIARQEAEKEAKKKESWNENGW